MGSRSHPARLFPKRLKSSGVAEVVLALDAASFERTRCDVPQPNIARHGTEQRDAASDQHRDAVDDDPMDQSGFEKALDGEDAVDIDVTDAAGIELGRDPGRLSR